MYRCLALVGVLGLILTWSPATALRSDAPDSLDAQYARAKLALAEANLARAERMNQRVANAVAGDVVADYRVEVELGRQRVADAERGNADSFEVWLAEVERAWKAADTTYNTAKAANDRTRGTIDPADVERLRLRAMVLELNLKRGQAAANQPRSAQLAWRISALSDELSFVSEDLRRGAVGRVVPGHRYDFFWPLR